MTPAMTERFSLYAPAVSIDSNPLHALSRSACLCLRHSVTKGQADIIDAWLRQRTDAGLRLDSSAVDVLTSLSGGGPRHLQLGRDAHVPPGLASLTRVETVLFSRADGISRWLSVLPNVRFVRILLHGDEVDAAELAPSLLGLSVGEGGIYNSRALTTARKLRVIELRDVRLDDFAAIGDLPELRALRLARIGPLTSLRPLAGHRAMRSLALQDLVHLRSLDVLSSLPMLESIELRGLWQFAIPDAQPLFAVPRLARASVDIGGRRKNVEIIKRLGLPPAQRFDAERLSLELT